MLVTDFVVEAKHDLLQGLRGRLPIILLTSSCLLHGVIVSSDLTSERPISLFSELPRCLEHVLHFSSGIKAKCREHIKALDGTRLHRGELGTLSVLDAINQKTDRA